MKKEHLLIALSASFFGFITVGGRLLVNLGYSLYEVSLFPVFMVMLILSLMTLYRQEYLIQKVTLPFFVIYGLIGALLQVTQYGGIVLGVPIAIVAMLLYTQPIWTTILGKLWLGEKITRYKIMALFLTIVGVFILLNPSNGEGTYNALGIIFALLGGIFLSLWVIWGRKSHIDRQHPLTKIWGYAFFTSLWLMLMFPLFSLFTTESSFVKLSLGSITNYWPYLLSVVFLGYIIPYLLFLKGIRKVDASSAGTIMMLEPVAATLMAAAIFGEAVTLNILIGGAFILLSNYIIMRYQ